MEGPKIMHVHLVFTCQHLQGLGRHFPFFRFRVLGLLIRRLERSPSSYIAVLNSVL